MTEQPKRPVNSINDSINDFDEETINYCEVAISEKTPSAGLSTPKEARAPYNGDAKVTPLNIKEDHIEYSTLIAAAKADNCEDNAEDKSATNNSVGPVKLRCR